MKLRARGAKSRRRGFTLIEVMVSLGIMMMGAMTILTLQQHTIRANTHARKLTIAMQIAQRWVERFKQDALLWRVVGVFGSTTGEPNDATVLTNTRYLQAIATAPNVFQTIPGATGTPGTVSHAFDFKGNDTADDSTGNPIFYCAAFRPAWVFYGRAMRVDVRVFWPREETVSDGNVITSDFPRCGGQQTQLDPGTANSLINNYHVVYLPTVIRVTPQ